MNENAFEALVSEVNAKISEMNAAISGANGAAAQAREAADAAHSQAEAAQQAVTAANNATQAANAESAKWAGTAASATTLEPGSDATASLTEEGGTKKLVFGLPRGERGEKGDPGEPGRSGITLSLSGTVLNITTE